MKAKRKPWPYWAKVLRNLLLSIPIAFYFWQQMGDLLPAQYEFRLTEKSALIPPTDIVLEVPESQAGRTILVGVGEDVAVVYDYNLDIFLLTGDTMLLRLPWARFRDDANGAAYGPAVYAAICPPEGAEAAVLQAYDGEQRYDFTGMKQGGNAFLFVLWPTPNEDGIISMGESWYKEETFSYTLTFYNKNGDPIQSITREQA